MKRVKDLALADGVGAAEKSWWSVLLPVSMEVGRRVSSLDLSGATVSCFQHLTMVNAATMLPLIKAGARLRIAAVNPDSTDDVAAAYLAAQGAEVWAWSRMTNDQVGEGLEWLLSEPADAVSDMGGECIAALVGADSFPAGALEATTSGLHRLAGLTIPFRSLTGTASPSRTASTTVITWVSRPGPPSRRSPVSPFTADPYS